MANPIKVFLVVTKANLGGAQRYVFDIARSLPKDVYQVTVIVGGDGWLREVCTQASIPVVTLSALGRNVAFFKDVHVLMELIAIFRREKPDIVHLNSSKIGGIGALAGRISGIKKIIFTAHGWAFNEERPIWQKTIITLLAWVTILLSHSVICVSNAVKKDAERLLYTKKKLRTVPIGIEPRPYMPPEEARQALAVKNAALRTSAVWVMTIAELHKNKGLDIGIHAWQKARAEEMNMQWIIIGDGEETDRLKLLAAECPEIRFLGFIEDAPRYLAAADIFLLPSRTEAAGYVLLEAGAAGLPVVASSVGGIPEIIRDGESGILVPSHAPERLAESLKKLGQDNELRERLGRQNRVYVTENFPFEKMLRNTVALYSA